MSELAEGPRVEFTGSGDGDLQATRAHLQPRTGWQEGREKKTEKQIGEHPSWKADKIGNSSVEGRQGSVQNRSAFSESGTLHFLAQSRDLGATLREIDWYGPPASFVCSVEIRKHNFTLIF